MNPAARTLGDVSAPEGDLSPFTGLERGLIDLVRTLARENGWAFASYAWYGKQLHRHPRHVGRTMRALVASGILLARRRRKGTTMYRVNQITLEQIQTRGQLRLNEFRTALPEGSAAHPNSAPPGGANIEGSRAPLLNTDPTRQGSAPLFEPQKVILFTHLRQGETLARCLARLVDSGTVQGVSKNTKGASRWAIMRVTPHPVGKGIRLEAAGRDGEALSVDLGQGKILELTFWDRM
jgi:hypothetical protein